LWNKTLGRNAITFLRRGHVRVRRVSGIETVPEIGGPGALSQGDTRHRDRRLQLIAFPRFLNPAAETCGRLPGNKQ
jgi:hypothetical protein